ncbi:hypothetical protein EMCRGX_G013765 [Ephydatia muelleri]
MDHFNVSNKFYHELSMVQPTIPRSHRIKRVRSELNQSLKTKMYRVPGPNYGVYCSLTERLHEELEVIVSTAAHDVPNCILDQIQLNPDSNHDVFRIKLSGDGAKYSRRRSKVLLMFLGFGQANSKYACIWCLVPSTDCWNTSKQHKARTIKDIESCAGNSRESYSVKYCPLLPIDLDHVVPDLDELHWFLRIMDVLLENVVLQVVQLDVKVNKKQADPLQGAMLQKLVESVQACRGAGMRKVHSKLPAYFKDILPQDCSECITQLWKNFEELHTNISSWTPDSDVIETKVKYPATMFTNALPLHQGKAVDQIFCCPVSCGTGLSKG